MDISSSVSSTCIAIILSLLLTFFNELDVTKQKWFMPLALATLVYACVVLIKEERGIAILCAAVFIFSVRPYSELA